jgi:hypothetical protein
MTLLWAIDPVMGDGAWAERPPVHRQQLGLQGAEMAGDRLFKDVLYTPCTYPHAKAVGVWYDKVGLRGRHTSTSKKV